MQVKIIPVHNCNFAKLHNMCLCTVISYLIILVCIKIEITVYRIRGTFDGDFNLAVWQC